MMVPAKLKVAGDEVNLRSEPSARGGESTILRVLRSGDEVEQVDYARSDPSWAAARAQDGTEGFVKRMLMFQASPGEVTVIPRTILDAYNEVIWEATEEHDGVTYKLGAKDPRKGEVDCSGWVCFINRLAFSAANTAAGAQLFKSSDSNLLNTHSDHQVSLPGYASSQLYSLDAVSFLKWRPGLLIGINFADYDWEKGQGRVFEIDHIVQTMAAPDGTLYITQSSSGGGGVNKVELDEWLKGRIDQLRAANRVHVADVFGLAEFPTETTRAVTRQALQLPELDVSRAPAG